MSARGRLSFAAGMLLTLSQVGAAQLDPKINPFTGQPRGAPEPSEPLSLQFATYVFLIGLPHMEQQQPGFPVRLLQRIGLSESGSASLFAYSLKIMKDDAAHQARLNGAMCARVAPAMTIDAVSGELVRLRAANEAHQEGLAQGAQAVISREDKAKLDSWVDSQRKTQMRPIKRSDSKQAITASGVEPTTFLLRHCSNVQTFY